MLIEKLNTLKKRVYLRNIKGIMVYYYQKQDKRITIQLKNDVTVYLNTDNPELNRLIVTELDRKLKQFEQ